MASSGDIAIVGYGADTGVKSFAFVLLADLSGETITFTDNGWRAAGGFRAGEGTVSYTVPAGTAIGTVVTISGLTGSFNPSTTGDSIIAYVGDAANPTFLFAVDFADANTAYAGDATNTNTTAVPTGLTFGTDALAFAEDNAAYSGPLNGSRAEILAAIADETNWTVNDTAGVAYPASFAVETGAAGQFSVADVLVDEGNDGVTEMVFTVERIGGSTGAATVDYAATFGTADAADVASALPAGTLTFADGETSRTVRIAVSGDTQFEADETIALRLSNGAGASIADGEATGTVRNDDIAAVAAQPWINEFHYDDASGDEGEFIEIAGVAGLDLTGYSIVLYNGNNGAPYGTIGLSGIIADQQNGFGTISVAATGLQNGAPDGLALIGPNGVVEFLSYEGSFTAVGGPADGLTSTDAGVIEPGDAEGTSIGRVGSGDEASDFTFALITDDTPGAINVGQSFLAAVPQVSVTDISFSEGNADSRTVQFTVVRNGAEGAFSVDYATADGTATAGADYVSALGTLTFEAGQDSAIISVTVLGDTLAEGDETFFLNLTNPTGGAQLSDAQGQAVIRNDDDLPPSVSISDASVMEGDSGQVFATFTVTRTGGETPFSVAYQTVSNTATAGTDFDAASGVIEFATGQTSTTITVAVNGDETPEATETFFVSLSDATGGATLQDGLGRGTILTDDVFAIHDVQGSAHFSALLASDGVTGFNTQSTITVTIQAVVTAADGVGARQGFYLMEEEADWDISALTSEGIFVMTRDDRNNGRTLAAVTPDLRAGDLVTVTAHIMEYQAFDNLPRTVLMGIEGITVDARNQALPTLVLNGSDGRAIPNSILTDEVPNYFNTGTAPGFDPENDALDFFETIEGMHITVPDMVAADGFVSTTGGDPYFKAYSTVHADADQINSRGGYTVAGDPPLSPPNTPDDPQDDTHSGGNYLHDGDVNPDIFELDFSDFATPAPAVLTDAVSMGDKLGDVTGILEFDFTDLKLFVTEPVTIVEDTTPVQEVTTIAADSRALTFATFNVENLDPTDGTARFAALADAIANNLGAPDILSIEEIQDNNGAATGDGISTTGTDASRTWELLIDAVNAATGERYQWVDEAPVYNAEGGEQSGNIRVGFLYNTNRVQLGNLTADASLAERRAFTDRIGDGVRDAGDAIAFDDSMIAGQINTTDWTNTRKSLLGEFTFNGNAVYVTANHLPSKGGSGQFWQFDQNIDAGQPENAGWEKRSEIADDIWHMLDTVQSGSSGNRIIAGGDWNDFYFYRPLEAATGYVDANGNAREGGARFDNLTVTELTEAERYTYAFDGRSQAIDHVLVDQQLSAVASYDVVHINTGYNSQGGVNPALSDHDPALAQFDFRNFAETLNGTAGVNLLQGFGGNDRLSGNAGDDVIEGGAGDDLLTGGLGSDALSGGAGSDTFFYDANGAGGSDRIIDFGSDDFIVTTTAFRDRNRDGIISAGHNALFDLASGGSVAVASSAGGTVRSLEFDGAFVRGGTSYFVYSKVGSATDPNRALAQFANDVVGGGDETLNGTTGNDMLEGRDGNERIFGLGGNDTLDGGNGDDLLVGGQGSDVLIGGTGSDTFLYEAAGAGGRDRIADFSDNDFLVSLTALPDRNSDGIITAGRGNVFTFGNGSVALEHAPGAGVRSLEFDGTVMRDGTSYYVYSLIGSTLDPAGALNHIL
ncbi:Calx-beta domain-containing protein [Sphingomonas sp. PB2P19]|uniref:Calx-beta domain-containing protein n=1 Tax=Sphingomonas rhamnosi TaxID=3096156 RepID=UPI002FCA87BD